MTKKIIAVVTNVNEYQTDNSTPTGLWLSELTHFLDVFQGSKFEIDLVSPNGGKSPLEPKSLGWLAADHSTRKYLKDSAFMERLNSTIAAKDIDWQSYSAIYYTGGHGVMFDFLNCTDLQNITSKMFENGKIVASVCHGYCGLLNVKLSNGDYLIKGRTLTGFSYLEEKLAGVANKIPYNVEQEAISRGAIYKKRAIPFLPHVKVDGNLVTGQNPGSAKLTAKHVLEILCTN